MPEPQSYQTAAWHAYDDQTTAYLTSLDESVLTHFPAGLVEIRFPNIRGVLNVVDPPALYVRVR